MIQFPAHLIDAAQKVLSACTLRSLRLVTAESCTGGLIAACLTEVSGSSSVLEAGFVTYANDAKETMLDIAPSLIRKHGAVSEEVAVAMARGALAHSAAGIAVSATGIAGPGGATETKPVGLVHLAVVTADGLVLHRAPVFEGARGEVREQAVAMALEMLLEALQQTAAREQA